jgi:hypothetical protein
VTTCSLCGADHLVPLDSAVVERTARWLDRYTHKFGEPFYSVSSEAEREEWRVDARCFLSSVLGSQSGDAANRAAS